MTVAVIIKVTLVIGAAVNNAIGKAIHEFLEKLLSIIPWYKFLKEAIGQFINTDKSPFNAVALAQIYGNASPLLITCFVTDETVVRFEVPASSEHPAGGHEEKHFVTLFMPTGPNPTSGWIFHMPKEFVTVVDTPVDVALKSIIGCGVGSQEVIAGIPGATLVDLKDIKNG